MNKKKLKKRLKKLESRLIRLESESRAALWNSPKKMSFPQFARKVEREISRLRAGKDG